MMYKLVLLVSIFVLILIVYKNNPEHFENPDNKKNNKKNNNSNSNNADKKPENLKRVVCNIIQVSIKIMLVLFSLKRVEPIIH